MFAQHHRFAIWNSVQHPFKHGLSEFPYTNPALPTGTVFQAQQALDWIFAVVYPNSKPAVATPADLPLVGNTLNDYRVVQDDGDGKAAGYRWEQREGEAAPSWHKILDVDWGTDSILQAWQARTQYLFMMKWGYDDIDASGAAVVGTLAGQTLYGGKSAGTNLTLYPNSGDGAGAVSGYVQTASHFRPIGTTNTLDLGDGTHKFRSIYLGTSALVGTTTYGQASINDGSGSFTFNALDVSTTGDISATSFIAGTLTLAAGSITDSSHAISFGDNALTTTGRVTANDVQATGGTSTFKSGTQIGTLTFSNASIVDSGGSISFGAMNLSTTGTLGAGASTLASATIGNVTVNGGTVSTNAGNLILDSTSGTVTVSAANLAFSAAAGTSLTAGNLSLSGNTFASTNANGDINVSPNGSGAVVFSAVVKPSADNTKDLGASAARWATLYLGTGISDGTNSIDMATLLSFRGANTGVAAGMTLFWDNVTSTWKPSLPDTEIVHNTLSGLTTGDAGHTQFAMLAGRAGGQTLQGDTAASGNLTLDSTAHATKGFIVIASTFQAGTDATFDIGDATHRFKDVYSSGNFIGFRLQTATTAGAPAASAGNIGRLYYNTDEEDVFVDQGGTWAKISVDRAEIIDTTGWDGVQTQISYDVSSYGWSDARKGHWILQKNASNRLQMTGVDIDFPDATHVRVTVSVPLPAGTYTLVGIG